MLFLQQVENGDLNWILPGKLLAFSGPAARPTDYVGFRAMVPEDYWDYFRRRGMHAIVRLNKKVGGRAGCIVGSAGNWLLVHVQAVLRSSRNSAHLCRHLCMNLAHRSHPDAGQRMPMP
jgi:hypothetical protein